MTFSPSTIRFNRTRDSQLSTRVCFVCEKAVSYGQGTDVPTGVNIAGQMILGHSYCVQPARNLADAERQAEARARVEEVLTGESVLPYVEWCADCGAPSCRR